MKMQTFAAALAGAAALVGASAAQAVVFTHTYTGKVGSIEDNTGRFGDWEGKAFSAKFTFDSDAPGVWDSWYIAGSNQLNFRGYAGAQPVVEFTIDGESVDFDPWIGGSGFSSHATFGDLLYTYAEEYIYFDDRYDQVRLGLSASSDSDIVKYADPRISATIDFSEDESNFSSYVFDTWMYVDTGDILVNTDRLRLLATLLVVEGVAPPPAATAPEPSTWGLLICGFGVAGWRLRRRAGAGAPA